MPLRCAISRSSRRKSWPTNARIGGDALRAELHSLLDDHPHVGDIRGIGQMTLVEMVADKGTKAKYDPALRMGDKLTMATRDKGIIVRATTTASPLRRR